MEAIYGNVDRDEPVSKVTPPTKQDSSSSNRFVYLAVLLLGLLSVSLLTGMIVLGVYYYEMTADLIAIRKNLTEDLQTSNSELFSMKEERNQLRENVNRKTDEVDQLRGNLNEKSEEVNRLRCLLKQITCPAGWKLFGCSCYLLSSSSDSWDKARENCSSKGADLVVINSAEEQEFLSGFTNVNTWIGLSDKETEGVWKWVDGTELTFSNWGRNQPDNGDGFAEYVQEDCAHFGGGHGDRWNDIKCSSSQKWICEMKPN